jgi:6,7-dimethyl-8-ribityllumazine synthase
MADKSPHLLVIESRFYEDIADELLRGAVSVIEGAGATYERISVPGTLEIPPVLAMALDAMNRRQTHFDGAVCLGCVIRGETKHFDIVSEQSARALMDISVDEGLALGNGILTVENDSQAWARASVDEQNKGGAAADAALAMIVHRKRFGL